MRGAFLVEGRARPLLERLEPRLMLDGTIWYVDDVTDPLEDGSADHPFDAIQEAIVAATGGDEVAVLPGTYTGDGNRDIDFMGKPITVRSTDPQDPAVVDATIVDAEGTAEEHHRGFHFHNAETNASILNGLTIRNGYADVGGGILVQDSAPRISDCVVMENHGSNGGGGLFISGSSGAEVTGCTISLNTSEANGGGLKAGTSSLVLLDTIVAENTAGANGGGMSLGNCSAVVVGCQVRGNQASPDASGMGGGVHVWGGDVTVADCLFLGNQSGDDGGGIFTGNADGEIAGSVFVGNHSGASGGAVDLHETRQAFRDNLVLANSADHSGGGVRVHLSGVSVAGNVFAGNYSAGHGGAIYLNSVPGASITSDLMAGNFAAQGGGAIAGNASEEASIAGCTLSHNFAGYWGGMDLRSGAPVTISDCVVWGNQPGQITDAPSAVVTYCDVDGGHPGVGNIDTDPLFVGGPAGTWSANGVYDEIEFQTTLTGGAWTPGELAGKTINPNTSQALQFYIVDNDATTITVWGDVSGIAHLEATFQIHDYHLQPDSPCIDAGCDASVYVDIEGITRPADFPGVDNNGPLPEFDMGAYEATAWEGAEIRGAKWDDLDRDGVWDAGEPGLPGVTIYLDLDDDGQLDAGEPMTVTADDHGWTPEDETGTYTFAGLAPGTHAVAEVVLPSWSQTYPGGDGRHVVSVAEDEVVENVDFGNNALRGEVHGAKWDDMDGDGVWDMDEPTLQGWTIYLDLDEDGQRDEGEPWDETDGNGEYAFIAVPIGTYVVAEVAQTGWIQTCPGGEGQHVVTLDPDEVITGIDFGNVELGEIHGTKWEDLDGDGQWDAGEPGMEGVTIYLDIDQDGEKDAGEPSVVTNENGEYAFTDLVPAAYTLAEVVPAGYAQTFPAVPPGTHAVALESGQTLADINFGNRLIAPEIDVEIDGLDDVHLYDFGQVTVGHSAQKIFTVRNEGIAELHVTQASGLASPFSISPVNGPGGEDDWTVLPGETSQFTVIFSPTTEAAFGDTLVLSSDDPDEAAYEIVLSGTGAPPYQIVRGEWTPTQVVAGSQVAFEVIYETSTGDETLTGLGLRMHWDSSALAYDGVSDVFPSGLQPVGDPQDDTADYDGDPATDRYVTVFWLDLGGNWPGGGTTPLTLFMANFVVSGTAFGSTSVNFSASSTAAGYELLATSVEITELAWSLDVDDNGAADALTDGIMIVRHLAGLPPSAVVQDAIAPDATRTDPNDIAAYIEVGKTTIADVDGIPCAILDVDADGVCNALTDGIMIVRHLAGLPPSSVVQDAVGPLGLRTEPAAIVAYIDAFMPVGGLDLPLMNAPASGAVAEGSGIVGSGNRQIITPNPAVQEVAPDSPVSLDAVYTTSTGDETLTGLGLRLHWDSSVLTYEGLSDVFAAGLQPVGEPQGDDDDYDDDPNTDEYITVFWMDLGGNWPGAGTTPLTLLTADFTTATSFGSATQVNYSASSTPAGYVLEATSAQIRPAGPPQVVDVRVGGALWAVPDGPIPVGSTHQLDPLGWATIDQVKVIFSEDVVVGPSDFHLSGVNVPVYDIVAVEYDPQTHTATLQLASDIDVDVLTLTVEDAVTDQVLNALDGEWVDTVSTYPSGDTTAGGDFNFKFKVLPGESNHDRKVDGADYTAWADNYHTNQTMYTQGDWTADGYVDGADYTVWADNYGDSVGAPAGAAERQAAAAAVLAESGQTGSVIAPLQLLVGARPAEGMGELPAGVRGRMHLPGSAAANASAGFSGRRRRALRRAGPGADAGAQRLEDGLDLLDGPSLLLLSRPRL